MRELELELQRGNLVEAVVALAIWTVAAAVACFFVALLGEIVLNGLGSISWEFLVESPRDSGRSGGIASVLVSTLWIVGIATAIAFPLSLGTAVFLMEMMPPASAVRRWILGSLDVLAGVPSVVFGLFGNALFCEILGLGYSLISGALTLVCMVLPFMIRASCDGLIAVPTEMRAAGSALALNKASQLYHVIVPWALPGIVAGALLGIARALAETAALLFTSGYVSRMPESLSDSGRTVSIHVYDLAMNVPGGDTAAYGSATVLIVLLLAINAGVVGIGRYARRHSFGGQ